MLWINTRPRYQQHRPEREGRRRREEEAAAERDRRCKALLVKGLGVVGREASQVPQTREKTEAKTTKTAHTYTLA